MFPTLTADQLKTWNYPGGEVGVRVQPGTPNSILWRIQNSSDLVALLMTAGARPEGPFKQVCIPYMPYARQDRVAVPGDPIAIDVVAKILSATGIEEFFVIDAHSEATETALRRYCTGHHFVHNINPLQYIYQYLLTTKIPEVTFISPDKGARKKTEYYAEFINANVNGVVYCDKVRNPDDGKLIGFKVAESTCVNPKCFVIVDDICDGGRTFIGVKEAVLKSFPDIPIHLWTTHAIYSAGLEGLGKEFVTIGSTDSFLHGKTHPKLVTIPLYTASVAEPKKE